LTSLVKKLEQATADHKDAKLGTWVVILSDDEKVEGKLKELAEKENVKKTILAVESIAGPPKYEIAKDAEVTVLLYTKKSVKKNMAYGKGEFNEKEADKIVDAVKELTKK